MRLPLIFGTLLLLGAVPLVLRANNRLSTYRRQKSWPKVPGTILESKVVEHRDDNGPSYTTKLVYRYSVNGREYESSQHTDGYKFPGSEADAQDVAHRFPVGSMANVSINPNHAAEAILDTGFPKVWKITQRASLVGIAIGLAVVLYYVLLHHDDA